MQVEEAVKQRKSVRAFKPDLVPLSEIRAILEIARAAPSGGNLQPWRMIVITGHEIEAVRSIAMHSLQENPLGQAGDYPIYPPKLNEPYRTRRYLVGEALYAILGIAREDSVGRLAQMSKNYEFFGAPLAIFFVIDRAMGHGQWAHMGMLMQTICLVAQERGLATCMQEAWAMVRDSVGQHFGLAPHEMIYCAMAMGYEDTKAPINQLRTGRAHLDEIATFLGFASQEEQAISLS
ncbi:nitroreductase [Candidatus Phycosocius spiralis]|uniref:NADH dehydrogenase n=1 Tax=Candidatus Phycosocius spiralis TaxID=2815099 RepID=A0ABQ4PX12_9PROT|nr:nitroreductase [Candidatus Phycosocius spiralis]GIU67540.1 NADH dehydrogenase [Candidatus Phycosocius spiralis]